MKRFPTPALLAALAVVAAGAAALVVAAEEKAPDVLIISGGGTPSADMGKFTAQNVDAVSCPTPVGMNCMTVSQQAAEALRAKGLTVRVADALEIKHRDEIMAPKMIVLASPSYFSNASWKMVKVFDEQFWQFHALGGEIMGGKPFATLVTGANEAKCKATADAMQVVVTSCKGTAGPGAIVLVKQPADEVAKIVAAFAEETAAKIAK